VSVHGRKPCTPTDTSTHLANRAAVMKLDHLPGWNDINLIL
jgi:hypothetical protein